MTETAPPPIANVAELVRPYDGCGFSVSADDDCVLVLYPQPMRVDCYERILFKRAKDSAQYQVVYNADMKTAKRTFEKGTVLGSLEDIASLEEFGVDKDHPDYESVYVGSYRAARMAFEQLFAIILEKSTM